jgi:DNA-binding transcriptional ArsR family regulator
MVTDTTPPSGPAALPPSDPSALSARLAALEARVAELEGGDPTASHLRAGDTAPDRPTDDAPTAGDDRFWALSALKQQLPPPGGVVFAGSVQVGAGDVEFQWGRPTEHLEETDWAEHAETVSALGHPLRLAILRRLLDGEHTVAQLVDELELASTGVAYHHLSALQGGGWVTSPRRGTWAIPPSRVIPLLTIVLALEKG